MSQGFKDNEVSDFLNSLYLIIRVVIFYKKLTAQNRAEIYTNI